MKILDDQNTDFESVLKTEDIKLILKSFLRWFDEENPYLTEYVLEKTVERYLNHINDIGRAYAMKPYFPSGKKGKLK